MSIIHCQLQQSGGFMGEWKRFEELPRRFLRAYERNIKAAPDFSENMLPNGAVIFQCGGAFPWLRFRRVRMSGVCCEVLAAYNAMRLAGIETELLKLSAEFEYNAAYPAFPPGAFGSSPFRIAECFEAYGVSFKVFGTAREFDGALAVGSCGVVSYRFGRLDPRLHTFAAERTEDGILAYNRYSNSREPKKAASASETVFDGQLKRPVFLIGIVVNRSAAL